MIDSTKEQSISANGSVDSGLRAHLNRIYGLMSAGVMLTFAIAYWVSTSEAMNALLFNADGGGLSLLGWIVALAPLGFILIMGFGLNKLPAPVITGLFFTLAACMGASMSSIFLVYTGASIVQVFLLTSIAFAGLSLLGYTTKKDLSGWGAFLLMGLIGLIGASILNIFIGSGAMDFAISVIGVLIFAGFTAYDTQRIKTDYLKGYRTSAAWEALSLYLNFINLFMYLLNLLGQKD